jgi:hypothetical protein
MMNMNQVFRENKDEILVMDEFPVNSKGRIRVIIESTNSDWRQGVHLRIDKYFLANGKKVKDIGIWDKKKNFPYEFSYESKNRKLLVWNIWDVGDGVVESMHNACGMIVEQLPNGRRYRCNDGHPDDDFDDLIFRIEVVEDKG